MTAPRGPYYRFNKPQTTDLDHRRMDADMTIDELAAASGVSRRAVVNILQGAVKPRGRTLQRIQNALLLKIRGKSARRRGAA